MVDANLSFSRVAWESRLQKGWRTSVLAYTPLLQLEKLTPQQFITEPHIFLEHCSSIALFFIRGTSNDRLSDRSLDVAASQRRRRVVNSRRLGECCKVGEGRNLRQFIEVWCLVFLADWSLAVGCWKSLHALMKFRFPTKKKLSMTRTRIM